MKPSETRILLHQVRRAFLSDTLAEMSKKYLAQRVVQCFFVLATFLAAIMTITSFPKEMSKNFEWFLEGNEPNSIQSKPVSKLQSPNDAIGLLSTFVSPKCNLNIDKFTFFAERTSQSARFTGFYANYSISGTTTRGRFSFVDKTNGMGANTETAKHASIRKVSETLVEKEVIDADCVL